MFERNLKSHLNHIVSAIVRADRKEEADENNIIILDREALENLQRLRDDIADIVKNKQQGNLPKVLKDNKTAEQIIKNLYKDKKMLIKRAGDIRYDLKMELRALSDLTAKDQTLRDLFPKLKELATNANLRLQQTATVLSENLDQIKAQLYPEHGNAEDNFVGAQRYKTVITNINALGSWLAKYNQDTRALLDYLRQNNKYILDKLGELEQEEVKKRA